MAFAVVAIAQGAVLILIAARWRLNAAWTFGMGAFALLSVSCGVLLVVARRSLPASVAPVRGFPVGVHGEADDVRR